MREDPRKSSERPRRPLRFATLIGEDPEEAAAQAASPAPRRVEPKLSTESLALDVALGGGFPNGSLLHLRTQEGAGGAEFAMAILRCASRAGRAATFLTALRSPERAKREAYAIFDGDRAIDAIVFRATTDPAGELEGARDGDVVVVEDAASIGGADAGKLDDVARALGEIALRTGAIILFLESAGTLPPLGQARLDAHADIICIFTWTGSETLRRRMLALTKLRGLAPVMESYRVPVFELTLKRGEGFDVTAITTLV